MFNTESFEFRELLKSHAGIGKLPDGRLEVVSRFYEEVLKENVTQNLTRLLSPTSFFEGHVLDAWELEQSGALKEPVFDLGTGMGSPGLIHAMLFDASWVLCDSEKHKIAFIERVVERLGIKDVSMTSQRAEVFLNTQRISTIVSKAVGKVEKLFGWVSQCSTWNRLILFKGPAWEDEWSEFQRSKYRKKLAVVGNYSYTVGKDAIQRRIIVLDRT